MTPNTKGLDTRNAILMHAVDVASAEGLEGLTIGRLASDLHMSKSGLFAHFGSKLDLQSATVETASRIFAREVLQPALHAPRGMARLWVLLDGWLSYVEARVFQGGCFFVAAAAEYDSRPGPIRARIASASRQWLDAIAEAARQAQTRGHVRQESDPKQVAFQANGCLLAANWARELLDDPDAFARARRALLDQLRSVATREGAELLDDLATQTDFAHSPRE